MTRFSIGETEYRRRIEHVRKSLIKHKIDALCVTNNTNIFYLTGFSFISTERPVALVIPVDGKITFMGPFLEEDHVRFKTRIIEDAKTYFDYPGEKHPIKLFADFLTEMGLADKRIGIDNELGAAAAFDCDGLPITKILHRAKFVDTKDLVLSMRLLKSDEEIGLIRESARWANLALKLVQGHVAEGLWNVEVELEASREASLIMKKTLGSDYEPLRRVGSPIGIVLQTGRLSAFPHAFSTKHTFKEGDVIITNINADVGGYSCELERTMILGKPDSKQQNYFNAVINAQNAAFEAFRAGARCSDIDKATIESFKKAGLLHLAKHHTGHGIGLEDHERPWLDIGNDELLQARMIVSCEPGIYETGFAGFRHSDTVLIRKNGAEIITCCPRDLKALTIGGL